MDKSEFQQNIMGKIILADFSAPWCGPCRYMEPVIDQLSETYKGRAEIIKIDVDAHRKLATEYMVQSIPTLILFKNGKEKKRSA